MDCTSHHVRGKTGTLFIGKEGDCQRPLGGDARLIQGLNHLKPAENTQTAVIQTTCSYSINVRPDHYRGAIFTPGTQTHDISNTINGDLQTQFSHPTDHKITPLSIFITQGKTTAAPTAESAFFAETIQSLNEPVRIDRKSRSVHFSISLYCLLTHFFTGTPRDFSICFRVSITFRTDHYNPAVVLQFQE